MKKLLLLLLLAVAPLFGAAIVVQDGVRYDVEQAYKRVGTLGEVVVLQYYFVLDNAAVNVHMMSACELELVQGYTAQLPFAVPYTFELSRNDEYIKYLTTIDDLSRYLNTVTYVCASPDERAKLNQEIAKRLIGNTSTGAPRLAAQLNALFDILWGVYKQQKGL